MEEKKEKSSGCAMLGIAVMLDMLKVCWLWLVQSNGSWHKTWEALSSPSSIAFSAIVYGLAYWMMVSQNNDNK